METLRPNATPTNIENFNSDANVNFYDSPNPPSQKSKTKYLMMGLLGIVFLAACVGGFYYYTQTNKPAEETEQDDEFLSGLTQTYLENEKAENEQRQNEDYNPEPIYDYPPKLEKFISDFKTGTYKVGITKITASSSYYYGMDLPDLHGESAYGSYAYFKNGQLVRFDRDVVKADFSEPIEPYSNTLISVYDPDKGTLTLFRPQDGTVTTFDDSADRIEKNNEKALGMFFETMKWFEDENEIYATATKDFYRIPGFTSLGEITFHLDAENTRIDSFNRRIAENKIETLRFIYYDITDEDLNYELPADSR